MRLSRALHQALGRGRARAGRPAPLSFSDASREFGATDAERARGLSKLTGKSVSTSRRWIRQGRVPSPQDLKRIRISARRRAGIRQRGQLRQRGARVSARAMIAVNGYERDRPRTVHFEGEIDPEAMAEIEALAAAGDREGAADAFEEALAEAHGFDSIDLAEIEWLDVEPAGGEEE